MWNINSLASSDLAQSGMLLRTSRTASGSDLRSKLSYRQSVKSCKIYPSRGDKIYLAGSVWTIFTPRGSFLSTSPPTWMFLVYPIRPHFLGHNFLSLNPSISDKKNIQTLRGEEIVWWHHSALVQSSHPTLHFIFCLSIEISKSCPALPLPWCWAVLSYRWRGGMIYQQ